MSDKPSTATYALLGLLAVQPWTGYELTHQAQRSLRYIWPTSEANLYREQKRLVRVGWATANSESVGRRLRKRYVITDAGRAALSEWARTKPQPPGFEVEGIVRLFFGDKVPADALEHALRQTASSARERLDAMLGFVDEYLDTGGPFPERLHVVSMAVEVITELLATLELRFDGFAHEVGQWATTADHTLDADTQARLERVRAKHSELPGEKANRRVLG